MRDQETLKINTHPDDPCVLLTNRSDGFNAIHRPGIKAVIWQRNLSEEFNAITDELNAKDADNIAFLLTKFARSGTLVDSVLQNIRKHFWNARQFQAARFIARDVETLTTHFQRISGPFSRVLRSQYCEDQNDVNFHIEGNAFFHADRNSLRMITNYAGPGTEWLPGDITRETYHELERTRDNSYDEVNRRMIQCDVEDSNKVCSLGIGDSMIFKGQYYKESTPEEHLIHRAPIPEIDRKRLTLIMTPTLTT